MKPNPSQYSGTFKNSMCIRCGKDLNNKNREEQDQHELKCKKQEKLFQ